MVILSFQDNFFCIWWFYISCGSFCSISLGVASTSVINPLMSVCKQTLKVFDQIPWSLITAEFFKNTLFWVVITFFMMLCKNSVWTCKWPEVVCRLIQKHNDKVEYSKWAQKQSIKRYRTTLVQSSFPVGGSQLWNTLLLHLMPGLTFNVGVKYETSMQNSSTCWKNNSVDMKELHAGYRLVRFYVLLVCVFVFLELQRKSKSDVFNWKKYGSHTGRPVTPIIAGLVSERLQSLPARGRPSMQLVSSLFSAVCKACKEIEGMTVVNRPVVIVLGFVFLMQSHMFREVLFRLRCRLLWAVSAATLSMLLKCTLMLVCFFPLRGVLHILS